MLFINLLSGKYTTHKISMLYYRLENNTSELNSYRRIYAKLLNTRQGYGFCL